MFEFPEHVIDGEVEGIHHAVLALVHNPERLAFDFEQLGAAVVAVCGMRDEESLIVGNGCRVQFAVNRLR